MATGVYRKTSPKRLELVHVAENYEAAETVASRFHENRKFNDDTYIVQNIDVFRYHPDSIKPEFIHQVIPFSGEYLYYYFSVSRFQEGRGWIMREYLDSWYTADVNLSFEPFYYVRADTEEEATERFQALLVTTYRGKKGNKT